MEIDVMLCDHAEAHQGKLFVNGAGINLVLVPPQPPHVIALCLAAVVQVPYTATNQMHTLTVRLLDQDGQAVVPWAPEGLPEPPPPVVMETQFNVGRPPMMPAGEAQTVPFAFGLQGLPLPSQGLYVFSIEIDGTELRRLPFRALVQQGPIIGMPGPSSIPGVG